MRDSLHVALIYGSTREGRFCDTVARWAAAEIKAAGGLALDVVDPAADAGGPDLRRRLAQADAFVAVTPEYNHGYPAPLKALIDSHVREWQAKPVGFVSYGGISGGLRAVEQLRLVFAELHAVTIRDSVSFANAWDRFDADGNPLDAEQARRSMARLLAQLRWWADALRRARKAARYAEVAA